MPKSPFSMTLELPEEELKEVLGDPKHLRHLSQKEVGRFDAYLRSADPQFVDGLSRFESLAIEGYIYQKALGNIDENHQVSDVHGGLPDG